MDHLSGKHAILFFARTPASEVTHKRLSSRDHINLEVLSESRRRTLQTLRKAQLPIFAFDETNQEGDDFGTRLSGAIASVFAKGFDKVLVVGSDCPSLTFRDIQKSIHLLEASQTVLGPDRRGGAYLIGLSKETFDKQAFGQLAWQSSDLAATLLNYFFKIDALPAVLDTRWDLNSASDVKRAWAVSWLRRLLISLFQSALTFSNTHASDPLRLVYGVVHRGPPMAIC